MREKLERTREGLTLHFNIITRVQGHNAGDADQVVDVDGYVTTGVYEDGRLGEVFIKVGKGDFGPLLDQWAIAFSYALQWGAPFEELCKKFIGSRFEPSGPVTGVSDIKKCTSPVDLVCRWLLAKYGKVENA